jgi:vacuolar-type H+-ATPase subunit E/Vma4
MNLEALYTKYDLLLPSKFDGGYLVIALFEKIKNREIEEYFTQKEINEILKDIAVNFNLDSVRQWSGIKDNLFHYFLRSHPDEPWKYYLTDYAKSVVDLMISKLENPYKNHPLKKSVQDSFTIRYGEIRTIEELERKFGRIFIQGSKKIITDHLEALEDELREAYKELNDILRKEDEQSATSLVRAFTAVFRKFGDRAEDITEAIISKDKFLGDLQNVVDHFYRKMEDDGKFDIDNVQKSKNDWEKAQEIYTDIREFFNSVDRKAHIIRRQINHASEKLTELQEQFSARAFFRLQIKKLHRTALESSQYTAEGVRFSNNFPLKQLVYEPVRMLYPRYYEFEQPKPNVIVNVEVDETYERDEKQKIAKEINRQQIINQWVDKAKDILESKRLLSIDELMNNIVDEEKDLSIAYQVASRMTAYTSEKDDVFINVEQKLLSLPQQNLFLWKTKMMK